MRYSPEHKQATRERIVRAAARRFRTKGTDGAAIGDLMRDLRLTHGGFYRHFDSKEDLVVEAFIHSLAESREHILARVEKAPPAGRLRALIEAYLDIEHCDNVAGGCPVAALATDVARRPVRSRARFLQALREHIGRVEPYLPGATEPERRQQAVALFTGMAGTLAIARAFPEERDRRAVLEGAKKLYLGLLQ